MSFFKKGKFRVLSPKLRADSQISPVEPARLGLLVTCYTLIQVSMVVKQVLNGLFCVVLSLVCPA